MARSMRLYYKDVITYDAQLSFLVQSEEFCRLVALSFVKGQRGQYAPLLREFLSRALNEAIAQMEPTVERKEYEEILATVKDGYGVHKRKKAKKDRSRVSDKIAHRVEREDVFIEDQSRVLQGLAPVDGDEDAEDEEGQGGI